MDLSELIKCYNMEHKSLFTAFAVSFPVLFTVLYLYIPEFANLSNVLNAWRAPWSSGWEGVCMSRPSFGNCFSLPLGTSTF